ncbi:MAG: hypothetical protein HGA94_03555, partial [Candidatus Aminicenantes bacterium]|nr:hypothetical protein [Candidatus Aminicenantes bacterium]
MTGPIRSIFWRSSSARVTSSLISRTRSSSLRVVAASAAVMGLFACGRPAPAAPIRVLLLSGQNNHDWKTTTPKLEAILEEDGRFEVDITGSPGGLTSSTLEPYDAILSNWNAYGDEVSASARPEEARRATLEFVRGGKGHIVVHAGSSSFEGWDDYARLTLAAWKNGRSSHGPIHEFPVRIDDPLHPVTAGLAPFTIRDELWNRPGTVEGAKVLASSFSAPDMEGTGEWEPAVLAGRYGKGRSLTILLGHELGHYLTCRRYGVRASLPFFLPGPPFLGTFGAFIRIKSPLYFKKQVFDVGANGPLAGFALTVPALAVGMALSKVAPFTPSADTLSFGEPLLFKLMAAVILPEKLVVWHEMAKHNRLFFGPQVRFSSQIDEPSQMLLFDAQTSGGLLLAVPAGRLEAFLARALHYMPKGSTEPGTDLVAALAALGKTLPQPERVSMGREQLAAKDDHLGDRRLPRRLALLPLERGRRRDHDVDPPPAGERGPPDRTPGDPRRMTELRLVVPSGGGGRADRFAADLSGLSRSRVQRLISEGRVTANGLPVKANTVVSPGAVLVIDVPPVEPAGIEPEAIPLHVVFEDPDVLVVDKPAGLVVHPSPGHWSGTLVNALLAR